MTITAVMTGVVAVPEWTLRSMIAITCQMGYTPGVVIAHRLHPA
jgi:hypothetical protein